MRWPVAVLAVLAVVGGLVQFAPLWDPLSTWLAPVAEPLAEASDWHEALASVGGFLLGAAGIYVAYEFYAVRAVRTPRAQPVLVHKLYWDELYTALFYRPADLIARVFARFFEQPVIAGSIREVTGGFRFGAAGLGRVQNGLVRSYALALASGIAVLAVVFLATR
jgi:NADH-quinone oxidoreductase subunit L